MSMARKGPEATVHFEIAQKAMLVFCRNCIMELSKDAIFSFIGYFKVWREPWSKFSPETVPKCNSTQHWPSLKSNREWWPM